MTRSTGLALAFALAGCGRLDFAPLADGPIGTSSEHDEDGDGIPDIVDPCPHLAGDSADRDGDGVGDACDPNPDTPTEHFLLFATMQPGQTAFDDITGWDQLPDAIHISAPIGAQLNLTLAVDTTRIDMGFDIGAVLGTQHQVAYGIMGPGEYYFTELNDDDVGNHDLGIVHYDAVNGYDVIASANSGTARVGPAILRTDAIDGPAPSFALVGGWDDAALETTSATPGYAGGTQIGWALNGIDITIRYLVVIATQ